MNSEQNSKVPLDFLEVNQWMLLCIYLSGGPGVVCL